LFIYYYFFALFVVDILFSNDIIKLTKFIKLTQATKYYMFLFLKKNIFFFNIFYIKTKVVLT